MRIFIICLFVSCLIVPSSYAGKTTPVEAIKQSLDEIGLDNIVALELLDKVKGSNKFIKKLKKNQTVVRLINDLLKDEFRPGMSLRGNDHGLGSREVLIRACIKGGKKFKEQLMENDSFMLLLLRLQEGYYDTEEYQGRVEEMQYIIIEIKELLEYLS